MTITPTRTEYTLALSDAQIARINAVAETLSGDNSDWAHSLRIRTETLLKIRGIDNPSDELVERCIDAALGSLT